MTGKTPDYILFDDFVGAGGLTPTPCHFRIPESAWDLMARCYGRQNRKEGAMPDKETYLVEIVRAGKTDADGKVVRKEEVLLLPEYFRTDRNPVTRELVLMDNRDLIEKLTAKEIADEIVVNIARPFAQS